MPEAAPARSLATKLWLAFFQLCLDYMLLGCFVVGCSDFDFLGSMVCIIRGPKAQLFERSRRQQRLDPFCRLCLAMWMWEQRLESLACRLASCCLCRGAQGVHEKDI